VSISKVARLMLKIFYLAAVLFLRTSDLPDCGATRVDSIHQRWSFKITKSSSWDKTAKVNFFYDDIVHAKYKTYCPTKRKFTKIFSR